MMLVVGENNASRQNFITYLNKKKFYNLIILNFLQKNLFYRKKCQRNRIYFFF